MTDPLNSTVEPLFNDGRQSPRAAAIQRGVCRLLRSMDFAIVTELSLKGGRRADVVALGRKGELWIIEVKSSVEDYRSDHKWHEYREHCDRLFFAVSEDMPMEIMPDDTGLIVADRYGAEIVRTMEEERLNAARRKAVTLRFARAGASRLHGMFDPDEIA